MDPPYSPQGRAECLIAGCARVGTHQVSGYRVAHVATEEYRELEAGLPISRRQAAQVLLDAELVRSADLGSLLDCHWFLVDESYHFYEEWNRIGILLDGFYVSGRTGAIEYRTAQPIVTYPAMQREGWPSNPLEYNPQDATD